MSLQASSPREEQGQNPTTEKLTAKVILSSIVSALPIVALRLGLLGWGCWLMADSLVGPALITGRLRLGAPPFQPALDLSKAIIHNPVANDALHHGSLVCFFGGASVIGLRRVAFFWEVRRGKDDAG